MMRKKQGHEANLDKKRHKANKEDKNKDTRLKMSTKRHEANDEYKKRHEANDEDKKRT